MKFSTYGPSDGSDHTTLPAAPKLPTTPDLADTGFDLTYLLPLGVTVVVLGLIVFLIARKRRAARG